MGKLDGKVAVITGGASGIGRGVALLFASEGAAVGIFDLNEAGANSVAAKIAGRGGKAAAAAGDVSSETDVKAGLKTLVGALGDVDIMVNNAGMDTTAELDGMATEMWDRMIAVHLRGTFLFTREVLPAMKRKKWGRIINLSSQLAHKGAPTMVHYVAAKSGIMGFTRSLAYEVARDGITVNCVNPGPINTPLLACVAAGLARPQARRAADRPVRGSGGSRAGVSFARVRRRLLLHRRQLERQRRRLHDLAGNPALRSGAAAFILPLLLALAATAVTLI